MLILSIFYLGVVALIGVITHAIVILALTNQIAMSQKREGANKEHEQ